MVPAIPSFGPYFLSPLPVSGHRPPASSLKPETLKTAMPPRKAFLIRVSPEVLQGLQRWANDELRSVNAQIEWILRGAVAKQRRRVPAKPEDDQAAREDDAKSTNDS